jgi:hypothetical protein
MSAAGLVAAGTAVVSEHRSQRYCAAGCAEALTAA